MLETVLLDRALCLPAIDIAALLRGQLIAVVPRVSVQRGWTFALYPYRDSEALPIEQQYRQSILPLAQATLTQQQAEAVAIEAWAKCEYSTMLHDSEQLEALSSLTIWTKDSLRKALEQRQHLFLAFLRVYRIPDYIQVATNAVTSDKFGKFVALSVLDEQFRSPLKVTQILPVLNDAVFNQRRQQLEDMRPPLYPELEELHGAIAQLAISDPAVRQLEQNIQVFLSWADSASIQQPSSDLEWIKTIDELGNRSKEQDDGRKSNYQAGTDFENIVKKSLGFLGFTVDEAYRGGAGGLDLFCSQPYPLVGECKAGKKIPSGTTEELVKLGGMHLNAERFLKSAKLIIGPGEPTSDVLTAADKWRVSIIKPMTLQKLAELQAKYPGSVNLIELKEYLEPGRIDSKIDQYIEIIEKEITLRANIIQSAKQLTRPEKKHLEVVAITTYYNVRFAEPNGAPELDDSTVHEILIELSSPLTGYLGRIRGTSLKTDRFYFLRDLAIA